jgi:hypothetical protein
MTSIQELAQLGHSACEIADMRNCSTQAVKTYCKNRNIKLQKKEEPDITESFREYFKMKVDIRQEDECWNWKGATDDSGYGIIFYKNKCTFTHRVAYMLYKDNTFKAKTDELNHKDSHIILHSCDNPTCCNPKHLSVGTPKDNAMDMVAKGRGRWQRKAEKSAEEN